MNLDPGVADDVDAPNENVDGNVAAAIVDCDSIFSWPFEALPDFIGFEPTPPAPDFVTLKENSVLAWSIFVPSVEAPGAASVD